MMVIHSSSMTALTLPAAGRRSSGFYQLLPFVLLAAVLYILPISFWQWRLLVVAPACFGLAVLLLTFDRLQQAISWMVAGVLCVIGALLLVPISSLHDSRLSAPLEVVVEGRSMDLELRGEQSRCNLAFLVGDPQLRLQVELPDGRRPSYGPADVQSLKASPLPGLQLLGVPLVQPSCPRLMQDQPQLLRAYLR